MGTKPNPDNLRTGGAMDRVPAMLWSKTISNFDEYLDFIRSSGGVLATRRSLESQLAAAFDKSAVLPGYCLACRSYRLLEYDRLYASNGGVNWRERLVCNGCHLNNRQRLSFYALEHRGSRRTADRIYLTEAMTPFAEALKSRVPGIVTSEFLGDDVEPGTVIDGVRHEDVTRLSFDAGSFDLVATFDVLEHVPAYDLALGELARVLAPGGRLVISVPFLVGSRATSVRAKINASGEVEHLTTPEYHGDPVSPDRGILCFYHFGWDMLKHISEAGFGHACITLYWSLGCGHLGEEQILIFATKK